ncbi:biofilm-dependent modulation protein [Salmonella enterica subsp. enterica serovar Typhi]|nr:biofilm-dependent modulation protein [Salmonella enterica subsp. enterica serovar Typhi]CGA00281.1 biofilm-dependent modulation protein [Salmonella enterica subsp. enterica serovar Typhi]
MFTYHSANTSAAQPALVNAIEQGLRAELGADESPNDFYQNH